DFEHVVMRLPMPDRGCEQAEHEHDGNPMERDRDTVESSPFADRRQMIRVGTKGQIHLGDVLGSQASHWCASFVPNVVRNPGRKTVGWRMVPKNRRRAFTHTRPATPAIIPGLNRPSRGAFLSEQSSNGL